MNVVPKIMIAVACLGCGGNLVQGTRDAGPEASFGSEMKPPTATVATIDAMTAPETSTLPPDNGQRPAIDCSAMRTTGDPGACGADDACAGGLPYPTFAEDLLACLVDKCAAERGQGPWCGDIMLALDATGCTNDYRESSSAGGCVKYQGAYRRWSCMAGKKITVSRICGK